MGGKKCCAVCPSDTAVALAVFDAQILIAGAKGERKIPVTDFFSPLGNALARDEMVREIEIQKISAAAQQRFLKFTLRSPVDFAVVSVASVITVENDICTDARIALGAVAPGPVRAKKAEEILNGQIINEITTAHAAAEALAAARPLSRNAYKIEIAKTLVKRSISG
jgi:xanthine dehydrogenase YagS FAD-binding subunit